MYRKSLFYSDLISSSYLCRSLRSCKKSSKELPLLLWTLPLLLATTQWPSAPHPSPQTPRPPAPLSPLPSMTSHHLHPHPLPLHTLILKMMGRMSRIKVRPWRNHLPCPNWLRQIEVPFQRCRPPSPSWERWTSSQRSLLVARGSLKTLGWRGNPFSLHLPVRKVLPGRCNRSCQNHPLIMKR